MPAAAQAPAPVGTSAPRPVTTASGGMLSAQQRCAAAFLSQACGCSSCGSAAQGALQSRLSKSSQLRLLASASSVGATSVAPAAAVSQGITRVGAFGPGQATNYAFPGGALPSEEYSMCTGTREPATGREFAIAGAYNGLVIVEVPSPVDSNDDLSGATPVSWFFEDGPDSRWRCVVGFRDYLYAGSFTHPGLRRFRIDTSLPQSQWVTDLGIAPNTVAEIGFAAPRATIDRERGLMFTIGADPGVWLPSLCVWDLLDEATDTVLDPPVLLAKWIPGEVMFEAFPRGDRAYVSVHGATSNEVWRVIDISSLWTNPPATPGAWNPQYAEWIDTYGFGGLSHDNYVTPDEQTWFVSYEGGANGGQVAGRDLGAVSVVLNNGTMPEPPVIGIYNLLQPGQVQESMHSMRGQGLTGYVSHWMGGVHVIDLSRPQGPNANYPLVASYDTSAIPPGYQVGDGVWDCYPHSDSGILYVNDSEEGLILLRVDVGHVNRYGAGTSNGNGVPRIEINNGPPRIDKTVEVEVHGMLPNSIGVLAFGGSEDPFYVSTQTPLQVLGAPIYIDLNGANTPTVLSDADGKAMVPVVVPNVPQLIGVKLFSQAFELLVSLQLVSSRGTWFGIAQ